MHFRHIQLVTNFLCHSNSINKIIALVRDYFFKLKNQSVIDLQCHINFLVCSTVLQLYIYIWIHACMLGHVQLFATPWTVACEAPLSMGGSSVYGISQARILEWVAISYSRKSSRLRDRTHLSCVNKRILPLSYLGGLFVYICILF